MRKRRDLETEVEELSRQVVKLQQENGRLKSQLETIGTYTVDTPEGCTRGPWCETCVFVKRFPAYSGYSSSVILHFCGKGEVCKGYVQKMEV